MIDVLNSGRAIAMCALAALSCQFSKEFYEGEDQLPLGIDSDAYRTTKMVFRRIGESQNSDKNKKSHTVGVAAAQGFRVAVPVDEL